MTELNFVGATIGALLALVVQVLARRHASRSEESDGLARLLDRLVDEQSVLDQIARDPFVGRDYARSTAPAEQQQIPRSA